MKQLSNSIYFVYLTRAVELRLVARFQLTINTFRIVSESIIIYALWPCSLMRATFNIDWHSKLIYLCYSIELNWIELFLIYFAKKIIQSKSREFRRRLVSVQIGYNFDEFFFNDIFLKLMSVFAWMFSLMCSNQTIITKYCVKKTKWIKIRLRTNSSDMQNFIWCTMIAKKFQDKKWLKKNWGDFLSNSFNQFNFEWWHEFISEA